MGRKKLEIKRIQDKSSRLVTFSKRRTGLFKKARHLSVLCDVDVAVVVFSDSGKLYEACSGGTNRYKKRCLEGEERTSQEEAWEDKGLNNPCTRTCKELLQSVRRFDDEPIEVSVTDMVELVKELNVALLQIRSKKTQLMMDRLSSFHEQERKLTEEKEKLKQQVAAAKQKDYADDGGGSLDDVAYTYQQLLTLPLFTE